MNCKLFYVLVPNESLEEMVLRQAHHKAAEQLSISDPDGLYDAEHDPVAIRLTEDLEDLTLDLVDHRDLWRQPETAEQTEAFRPGRDCEPNSGVTSA